MFTKRQNESFCFILFLSFLQNLCGDQFCKNIIKINTRLCYGSPDGTLEINKCAQ